MKKIILSAALLFGTATFIQAQPFALSLNNVDGSPYTCTLLEDLGIYKRLRVVANQNSTNGTWEFPALCSFPGNVYRPYTSGTAPIPFNAIIPPVPGTAAALYNSGNGGASGNLSPITNGNLYTFNIQNTFSASASPYFCVLETNYTPVTIPTVTQLPLASAVGPNDPVQVTITCSADPHTGENVFVRYTTDNFNSTSIVQASFTGSTGTATIPNFPFGTTVKYYIYSSSKSKALIESEAALHGEIVHDMSTLDWNTNISQNYSYTVTNVVPVWLDYFRGQKSGKDNQLSWKLNCTNGETAFMELQRSSDGRNFETIYSNQVDATRCSGSFQYTDRQATPGNNTYRLRFNHNASAIRYSHLISMPGQIQAFDITDVMPNPVRGNQLRFTAVSPAASTMIVRVTDISGRIMITKTLALRQGIDAYTLSIPELKSGVYLLQASSGSERSRVLRVITIE